jgi:5,10-methylene-tetrahydrofolate dehydrogenase/methenyl tetrahydrofolate cyclohydrolase
MTETKIPKEITNEKDIEKFWTGFYNLKKIMEKHKKLLTDK